MKVKDSTILRTKGLAYFLVSQRLYQSWTSTIAHMCNVVVTKRAWPQVIEYLSGLQMKGQKKERKKEWYIITHPTGPVLYRQKHQQKGPWQSVPILH